ncbi:MAG: glycosyltransferase [Moraxellaceae bacterium]|nr:glycosyltransferase [Moraxellaceae bacterium]MDZ4386021.1 glycosyltransferase [Moraxellaceae bacterium]
MRVLVVLPTAIMGGAERVIFNLTYELLAQGHSVIVYIMSRGRQPGWEILQGNTSFELIVKDHASEKKSLISFFYNIFLISRKNKIDLVISSHTHVNAVLSFFRKINILKCGFLISRESTFIFERFFGLKRFLFWILYRFFYGSQDVLVFQTEGMKKSLESTLGFKPVHNSIVLENPVALRFIDESLASKEYISTSQMRFVACGRLVPIKGFDRLLRVFAKTLVLYPNCILEIIGDGPERSNLEELACSLAIKNKVIFHGRVNNPFIYYRGANIGVVSSVKEGFPNVLIEMMACGVMSLVSTPCTDGVHALPNVKVSECVDDDCLFKAIISVVDARTDHSLSYRMYVESDRSISKFLERLLESY